MAVIQIGKEEQRYCPTDHHARPLVESDLRWCMFVKKANGHVTWMCKECRDKEEKPPVAIHDRRSGADRRT
jgi:hypothetical protein